MSQDLISKAWNIIQGIPGDIENMINPPQPPIKHGMTTEQAVQQLVKHGWRDVTNQQQPTPTPTTIPGNNIPNSVTPLQSPQRISGLNPANIDWLEQKVLPITRKAGLPDPLVAGQWAIEDRKKDTSMFNLLFDGQVHKYQNIENNVNDYVRTVTSILKGKGYDINQIKDPQQILTALQTGDTRYEGHSKDPMDYVKITTNTPEYKYYAQGGQNGNP